MYKHTNQLPNRSEEWQLKLGVLTNHLYYSIFYFIGKKEFKIIKQHYGSEFMVGNREQENPHDKVEKLSEGVKQ